MGTWTHWDTGATVQRSNLEDTTTAADNRFYKLTLNTVHKCGVDNDTALFLLMAVRSSPGSARRRAAIRETWGRERRVQDRTTRLVFFLGRAADSETQLRLKHESRAHDDVVQADFVESLRNLTLKDAVMMQWTAIFCSRARFVYKGDDDVFLNVGNAVNFLSAFDGHVALDDFVVGHRMVNSTRVVAPQSR